jgi:Family of unknown function (DUF5681)
MSEFAHGMHPNSAGTQFQKGVSGNPAGRPAGRPAAKPRKAKNIITMAHKASPKAMQYIIDVAHGKVEVSPELRMKACVILHERAYGRPPQVVAVDVALRKAVENLDPQAQLQALLDMRTAYVAQLPAPIEGEFEEIEPDDEGGD